jgi:hypothetical protein
VIDSADFTTGESMFLLLLGQRSVRTDSQAGLTAENANLLIELLLQEDEAESRDVQRGQATAAAERHPDGTPPEESGHSAASEAHGSCHGEGVEYESDDDDVQMPSFEELEAAPFGVRLV